MTNPTPLARDLTMLEWLRNLFRRKPCQHLQTEWRIQTLEEPVWNPEEMQYDWIKVRYRMRICVKCKHVFESYPL